jgi:arsenate reductase (thioredoxin)
MAEGFAKSLGFQASSAGTFPAVQTNPLVVEGMEEVGIDVPGNKPKELTEELIEAADTVVLTYAALGAPIPGNLRKKKKVVAWSVADPQGKDIEEIRYTMDQIKRLVSSLTSTAPR